MCCGAKDFCQRGKDESPREQEEFVRAIEERLRAEGLTPCTVGRNTWTAGAPLKKVMELMAECTGAVIVALERTYFPLGIERRGHPEAHELRDIRLPTPFNQVEAAMAYAHARPLLVIIEAGLREEGLLERGNDWYVQRVKPTPDTSHHYGIQWRACKLEGTSDVLRTIEQIAKNTPRCFADDHIAIVGCPEAWATLEHCSCPCGSRRWSFFPWVPGFWVPTDMGRHLSRRGAARTTPQTARPSRLPEKSAFRKNAQEIGSKRKI